MKRTSILTTLLLAALLLSTQAQAQQPAQQNDSRYLAGAVTLTDGFVSFSRHFDVPGKQRAEIFHALRTYFTQDVVGGPDHLPQARLVEDEAEEGLLAARMEEYLYFKRKAWVAHRVRFYYQLIAHVSDGGFDIEMRQLRYLYDDVAENQQSVYTAEQWITDEAALTSGGRRLTRIAGKFRRFTIDRKDELFRGAALAAGAKRKTVTRTVEVDDFE